MSIVDRCSKPGGIRWLPLLALAMAVVVATACDDDDDNDGGMTPTGTFALTFELDASFQGAHGGQTVRLAVVDPSDGSVVTRASGTVSASADPAFTHTTADVLDEGTAYEVHYWIDSNFMGGTTGVCDAPDDDHQWNVPVPAVSGDVTITEAHQPQETELVCPTFTADLTFAGDASYQAPHGDQPIAVAVVPAGGGDALDIQTGTVSATDDPSFLFAFPGLLVIGEAYEVHYWIDSNFMGGTTGVCDAPNDDHQWSLDVPAVSADVDISEVHDPGSTTDVCATFE